MTGKREKPKGPGPHTLAIDVGGTGIKASVLDVKGRMAAKRVRADTPHPLRSATLLHVIDGLTAGLPGFDRISLGFPGVVRAGHVVTAPNLGTADWAGAPLARQLSAHFQQPARILNDADVQGLGIIKGQGVEMVITLGTGLGSSLFSDGQIAPHLELAHMPFRKGLTFEDYVCNAARKQVGRKTWNRRVRRIIETIRILVNFDTLHVGGGNAKHLRGDLPEGVILASNEAGIIGGLRLWDDKVWRLVPEGSLRSPFTLVRRS